MSTKRARLRNKEYRAAYAESYLDSLIATQLRVLREQRGLSQRELAELAGMKQSRISTMENVNYCSWTVGTLKRLAQVFDVPLVVRFESFGALMGEAATLTRANLQRPSFEDDPRIAETVTGAPQEPEAREPEVVASVPPITGHKGRTMLWEQDRFRFHRFDSELCDVA